ncbi:MAG TPA: menaquinone-dependent protoporphyrinogen IX dehydrogenase [Woeseiaceae bacterium]|nr:menaquinone-dependent protoporphyrinogen IX dehydrogenase [Woeseiaceae bacterium]
MRILFLYSTVDGHTREICEHLQRIVLESGHRSSLVELQAGVRADLRSPDCIVIGASVRYGRHRPEVARFVEEHLAVLESKPAAFFSVNAVARKPDRRTPESNPYVQKFLASIRWRPDIVRIFGGKIDYSRYGFLDKTMIRLIMWMTHGPTDPKAVVDFTDWGDVDAFGRELCVAAATRPGA